MLHMPIYGAFKCQTKQFEKNKLGLLLLICREVEQDSCSLAESVASRSCTFARDPLVTFLKLRCLHWSHVLVYRVYREEGGIGGVGPEDDSIWKMIEI